MVRKVEEMAFGSPPRKGERRCVVEAVVTVDERGQVVLPKDIRSRAGIQAGDKLAIVGIEDSGQLCCLSVFKVDDLTEVVKTKLGPVMREAFED